MYAFQAAWTVADVWSTESVDCSVPTTCDSNPCQHGGTCGAVDAAPHHVRSEQPTGSCPGSTLQTRIEQVNAQCCGADDAACDKGRATSCDSGCAAVFLSHQHYRGQRCEGGWTLGHLATPPQDSAIILTPRFDTIRGDNVTVGIGMASIHLHALYHF